jgi:hypothetical protein
VRLDGQAATQTRIELRTSQSVDNTSGELTNRGLVLRTQANMNVSHTLPPNLRGALFINF